MEARIQSLKVPNIEVGVDYTVYTVIEGDFINFWVGITHPEKHYEALQKLDVMAKYYEISNGIILYDFEMETKIGEKKWSTSSTDSGIMVNTYENRACNSDNLRFIKNGKENYEKVFWLRAYRTK